MKNFCDVIFGSESDSFDPSALVIDPFAGASAPQDSRSHSQYITPNSWTRNMPESGDKESSNLTKRRRQSLDDDQDRENMPPKKQQRTCSTSGSSLARNSSPLSSNSEISHSGPCESSDECFPDTPQGILSPININFCANNTPKSQTKRPVSPERKCPLPSFSWADPKNVWRSMCCKDLPDRKQRLTKVLKNHPSLKLHMRAILVDWLCEVCSVYQLHRQTFHLCVNYLDRYMLKTKNIHRHRLQLIGITCLFIAAKIQEVYPPKIKEFAYVTDGACCEEEILVQEVSILNELNWRTSLMTANCWLNTYLQCCVDEGTNKSSTAPNSFSGDGVQSYAFLFTQYSSLDFYKCAQLTDLALLHADVNSFKYSQLAAAAISYIFDKSIAVKVSGYPWTEIEGCYVWLGPFRRALDDFNKGNVNASCGLSVNSNQSHSFQVHNISLDCFYKAEEYMLDEVPETFISSEDSPPFVTDDINIPLTPPNSRHKKHMKAHTDTTELLQ